MKKIPASAYSYGAKRSRSSIRYIVIHYTAGKFDTAENEGNYFKNVNKRLAGAHFFVGQDGTVVKSISLNRIAWSVGGARYADCKQTGGGSMYGIVNNANSVSIELCDNLDRDPSDAQIAGVKKAIKHIKKYCPNAKTIVRHFDVNGKHCPARMMDERRWQTFLAKIGEKKTADQVVASGSHKVKIITEDLNIRKGPGAGNAICGTIHKGETYTITEEVNGWGKLKSGIGWINCSEKYVKRV